MKKGINVLPPSGMRDFLPEQQKFKMGILNKIREVFESYGYVPIETPAMERMEVLTGKYGEEGENLIFKIQKQGEDSLSSSMALRYDFTVPLSRYYSCNRNSLPNIFKRYQFGPVWRAERAGKDRFREFYQFDIDVIGSSSILNEIEILFAIGDGLKSVDLKNFKILLNSRVILDELFNKIISSNHSEKNQFFSTLDKLDKIGVDATKEELKSKGFIKEEIEKVFEMILDYNFLKNNVSCTETIAKLEKICEEVAKKFGTDSILINPSLARGLNYYTDTIFEIECSGVKGSIAAGGRFDNLIGLFSNQSFPACGGSIGIERIFSILYEKYSSAGSNNNNILVSVWSEDMITESIEIFNKIRFFVKNTEIFLGSGNISKQFKYAEAKGCKYVVIYGPDEKSRKEVKVKDIIKREEKTINISNIHEIANIFEF